MDYGNTKTLRVNRRLGSATLSQRAFPREKQPEFPMGEIPLGQYRCLKKKKKVSPRRITGTNFLFKPVTVKDNR